MGDSETVVAQPSTVLNEASNIYPSDDPMDVKLSAADDSTIPMNAELLAEASANSDAMKSDIDPTMKPSVGEDGNPTSVAGESTSMELNQAAVYDASANGVVDGLSNGSASGSHEVQPTTVEQQFEDGSALSAEEERLWSIVKTNSLDFNVWTSLIDETERVAQDNILKIRKVYDAFLAEFPLCYGYWKKYADHEARFGDINKVVEVYERAVQGVTYSVDIWLHYCAFTITTYGDPDTVRSELLRVWWKGFGSFTSDLYSSDLQTHISVLYILI